MNTKRVVRAVHSSSHEVGNLGNLREAIRHVRLTAKQRLGDFI